MQRALPPRLVQAQRARGFSEPEQVQAQAQAQAQARARARARAQAQAQVLVLAPGHEELTERLPQAATACMTA